MTWPWLAYHHILSVFTLVTLCEMEIFKIWYFLFNTTVHLYKVYRDPGTGKFQILPNYNSAIHEAQIKHKLHTECCYNIFICGMWILILVFIFTSYCLFSMLHQLFVQRMENLLGEMYIEGTLMSKCHNIILTLHIVPEYTLKFWWWTV